MPRNLSLNISVGAVLDRSLGTVYKAATQSTQKLGKDYRRLKKELAATSQLKKLSSEMGELEKAQKAAGGSSRRLARRLDKTKDKYRLARIEAKRYGLDVGNVIREEKRLTRELGRQRRTLGLRQLGGRIGQGLGTLGRGSLYASGGLAGGLLAGGLWGHMKASNVTGRSTMARGMGTDYQFLQVMERMLQSTGGELNTEHVLDLFEEMQNKFGEMAASGEIPTAIKEGLHALNLNYDTLKSMKMGQRFVALMDAAAGLSNEEDAKSAVDAIMGAEANKFVGLVRQLPVAFSDYVLAEKEKNLVTQSAVEAARRYTQSFGAFSHTLSAGSQNLMFQIQGGLSPMFDQWQQDLNQFFSNDNKVQAFVDDIKQAFQSLGTFGANFVQMAPEVLSGIANLLGYISWFSDSKTDREEKRMRGALGLDEKAKWYSNPAKWFYQSLFSTDNALVNLGLKAEQTSGQSIQNNSDFVRLMKDPKAQGNQYTTNHIEIKLEKKDGESDEAFASRVAHTIEVNSQPRSATPGRFD